MTSQWRASQASGKPVLQATAPDRDLPVPNRYERLLERTRSSDRGLELGQRFAIASRTVRRDILTDRARDRVIRDVSAGVVAPTLVGFVLWVLLTAKAQGLRRLYFLSRDGQVLFRVAEILVRRLKLPLECHYLYASRQAWIHNVADPRHPAQAEWFNKDLWKRFRPGSTNIQEILSRIGIDPDCFEGLRRFPTLAKQLDRKVIRSEDVPELMSLLRSDPFLDEVARHRTRNRGLVLKYLEQEGVLDGAATAIVDSGWAGQIHKALCDLLIERGAPPVECFYFGFKEQSIPDWSDRRHWYLYSPWEGCADVRFRPEGLDEKYTIAYFEVFCAADHGTLVRYAQRGGRVLPVFPENWRHATAPWGLGIMRETIASFCEAVPLGEETIEAALGLRPAIKKAFEAFWLNPTAEEAIGWGNFPLDLGEGDGSQTVLLASPYSLPEVLATLSNGRDLRIRHSYHWIPGGLAMTSWPLRLVLRSFFSLRTAIRGAQAQNGS